jgi:radical SAM protein with 4Fe4S-binding SPASM domain
MESGQIFDFSTKRKSAIAAAHLTRRGNVPLFSIVEISAVAACNRRCSFCPVSDEYYKKVGLSGTMKQPLYEKLIDDLKGIEYSGLILFSGESEPLLHKRLDRMISLGKSSLPQAKIEINSNGDLLTEKKLEFLFRAGLDTLMISMYDGPHQIKEFTELRKRAGLSSTQILLRRRYLEDGNYGINMTNRGGLIAPDAFHILDDNKLEPTFPIKKQCFYPFYMVMLDVAGNVTICSHDWAKRYVVGNFKTDHIYDIWVGQKFETARKKLARCDRSLPACRNCNAIGTLIGQKHFDEWEIFYRQTLTDK